MKQTQLEFCKDSVNVELISQFSFLDDCTRLEISVKMKQSVQKFQKIVS